jgi:hypothetical protein
MLYAGTWTIDADKRSDAYTHFASMDEEALAADIGPDVKLLGRWHNPADGSGFFVCEAKSVTALHQWMWKSSEDRLTIKVAPVLNDDMCREVVLGTKPALSMSLDSLYDDPRDGESIYICHYKFHPEHKLQIYETFAGMTEEDETKDRGKCRYLGRFHNMSEGTGFTVVAATTNEIDLYKWAHHWAGSVDLTFVPVVKDKTAQEEIVKKKDGYDAKLASLKEKMKA